KTLPSRDRVIDIEHDHRADNRDQHGDEIEFHETLTAQQREQCPAYQRADKAQRHIGQTARAFARHDLVRDETGDKSENNPAKYRHAFLPLAAKMGSGWRICKTRVRNSSDIYKTWCMSLPPSPKWTPSLVFSEPVRRRIPPYFSCDPRQTSWRPSS